MLKAILIVVLGATMFMVFAELFLYYLHFVEVGKFGVPFSETAVSFAYTIFGAYLLATPLMLAFMFSAYK